MMARSSNAPSMGRIQKRKTNLSKSSLSACNARPVHTDGPRTDIRKKDRYMPSSEIQGDDQSGCVSVESSSDGPKAGRYRPKFNSKSLRTP